MVAADDDRRLQLAAGDHLVEPQARQVPLAVAEPADPRRKSLEGNAFAGQPDPACEGFVLREQFQHRAVGGGDVLGVTRQRSPAERAVALAEQRTDVCGHEAREVERALAAA